MDQPINPPVLQSVHQLALPLCRRTSNFPCRGPEISCVPVRPSVRVQFPTSPPVPPIIAATAPVPTPTPRTRNRTVAMQAEPSQKAKRRDATNLLCLRLPKGDDGPNVPKNTVRKETKTRSSSTPAPRPPRPKTVPEPGDGWQDATSREVYARKAAERCHAPR